MKRPGTRTMIEQARTAYIHGRITVDELEQRIDAAYEYDQQTPPPCPHRSWIDITAMGHRHRIFVCAECGTHRIEDFA